MHARALGWLGVSAITLTVLSMSPVMAAAQGWSPPLTPDGKHLPQDIRQWSGDSRGRWEGSTLIVDSTNFSPESTFMGSAENLHLVERFTRVAADRIDYESTLDDSTTWTKPWTAVIHLTRTAEKIYEVACHEGNYYTTQGTLAGARAQEKAADEAAKKRPQ